MELTFQVLIWPTIILLTGLGFYSLYGPFKKDSMDKLVTTLGVVGMLVFSALWSNFCFGSASEVLIFQVLLFIGEMCIFFVGLFAGMMCVMIIWCLFVLLFMKKHAKALFNYERKTKKHKILCMKF